MKKLSTFLLSALMLLASANVFAEDYTEGGVTYTISGSTAKATGVTSSAI